MHRQIVYVGENPLDSDFLAAQKHAMIGLGMALQAIIGTGTLVDGLACTPTSPTSLQVNIANGSIYSLANVDGTAYGSLASDTTHQIVKQGISLSVLTLSCPAPGTVGFSINYLIEAAFQEVDGGSTTLPYYNSGNPAVAYNGPGGLGTSQNTVRQGLCTVQVKAGTAATTGTQTTPAADAGFTGLWVVTVANGQTTITSGNISALGGAPFLTEKLATKISQATGDARYATQVGFQGNIYSIATAGGTADAITASYTPAITALTNGMSLFVRATSANVTTTPTFTPNNGVITAATIVKGNGLALAAGDISGAGHWIELQYDTVLTKWVLLNPATGISVGSSQLQKAFLTAGTTWTTPSNITASTVFKVTLVAGGGGCTTYQTAGGGQVAIKNVSGLSPSTAYTVAIGAGGAAGGSNAGGNTTFNDGSTTYTAHGGSGGALTGGLGGTGATNGDIARDGGSGGYWNGSPSSFPNYPEGGNCPGWGSGGTAAGYGNPASGYGAGGSGGSSGQAGLQGCIHIEWVA